MREAVAGHKAAVFDSAPRFWQGAPRAGPLALDKGLAGTHNPDHSTREYRKFSPAP
ncbi:hypothetical protein I603_1153 [Erythrobacter dokdonensis DSW-74]|uniref:Uncharacterized protein n=1 Tax=Erythrobacter dokdonensis DSW-74 TaxID=1300349 RepID=A0A1A7BKL3_9SPHN|nr:hypothetical protein I603_1153 [Erythrobacter dokdonensis DSW-74]